MQDGTAVEQLRNTALELASRVADPGDGDETYDHYLDWFARLHKYSAANVLLITAQCPSVSYVASYRDWQALDRQVVRGEAGIPIIRPLVRRVGRGITGKGVRWQRQGWGIGYVFDASQTTGPGHIPNYKPELPGDVIPLLQAATALAHAESIRVDTKGIYSHTNGFSQMGRVVINESRPLSVQLQALLHELAHEMMHDLGRRVKGDRPTLEAEAEATAVVCLRALGYDTLSNGATFIRKHCGTREHILASLQTIASTAHQILMGVRLHMGDVQAGPSVESQVL
jgi:hypothetical protein